MSGEQAKLSRKDFVSDQDVRWCPGCGDYAILAQVQRVMPELNIPRENIVFVSGIGCSSRFPYYMNTYGFHSIHGRATAVASGLKMARPELSVWVVTGDGDGLSIGGNHLIHLLRRNLDINILLFNNEIYGLTKGQYSPTSRMGLITKSSPLGVVDHPFDTVSLALGADATFVARTVDTETRHLQEMLTRAVEHKGTSFIEILQNCPIFNDGVFEDVSGKGSRIHNQLVLQHGQPLLFGPEDARMGVALGKDMSPQVVSMDSTPEEQVLLHDETNEALGFFLSRLERPEFPVPLGVIRAMDRPIYEKQIVAQAERALSEMGQPDFNKLFRGGDTWTVE
jgi:2-oxoglutarate ferredoxin oxidoreductase subunit beta